MKGLLLIAALAIIQSCSIPKKSFHNMSFDFEGHRGCRGLMPENTIPAMLKAIDLGVTTLEMDAVITKDDQVILSHEPFFNSDITTKPDGSFVTREEEKGLNIYKMTYDEVMKYDVGLKTHPKFSHQQKVAAVKPRLADVITSVEQHAKASNRAELYYNIETKCKPSTDNIFHPEPTKFVELLMAVIKEKGIEKRVIIQSFDIRTLQVLHTKYPEMKTSLLVENNESFDDQINKLGFIPTIYSPQYLLVDKDLVDKCESKNIQLIPWTVNSERVMRKLIAPGVDGLITDYPNLKY